MQITREIDYALRIMHTLAANSEIKAVSAADVSAEMCIPVRFTLKIMRKLSAAGLLRSYKGADGGYALAKDPSLITLLDIVEAVDGPIIINSCLEGGSGCTRTDFDKNACFYRHVFDGINDEIARRLRMITLDIAAKK